MATQSEQTFFASAFWLIARLLLAAVVIAVGIDYAYPVLPRGLQIQVMSVRHAALSYLLQTHDRIIKE